MIYGNALRCRRAVRGAPAIADNSFGSVQGFQTCSVAGASHKIENPCCLPPHLLCNALRQEAQILNDVETRNGFYKIGGCPERVGAFHIAGFVG